MLFQQEESVSKMLDFFQIRLKNLISLKQLPAEKPGQACAEEKSAYVGCHIHSGTYEVRVEKENHDNAEA